MLRRAAKCVLLKYCSSNSLLNQRQFHPEEVIVDVKYVIAHKASKSLLFVVASVTHHRTEQHQQL